MWTNKKKFRNAAAKPGLEAFKKFMLLREDYKSDKKKLVMTKQSKYLVFHILKLRRRLRELHAEYNNRWMAIANQYGANQQLFANVHKKY